MNGKRNISLDILRIISLLLIINSHADLLYPEKVRFIASGGAIGNGLFFSLSGYFYHESKINKWKAIESRFFRLFIPAWIMIIVSRAFGDFKQMDQQVL